MISLICMAPAFNMFTEFVARTTTAVSKPIHDPATATTSSPSLNIPLSVAIKVAVTQTAVPELIIFKHKRIIVANVGTPLCSQAAPMLYSGSVALMILARFFSS